MKITTLRLKNFGPFKDSMISFDQPIALILGDNATGKTSLATAIEVLLCGRASRFAGERIGLRALIGSAGDTAEVEGMIELAKPEHLILTRRIRPAGLATSVGTHDVTKAAYDFYSPPGMRNPERAWHAVCTVGGVLDQDDAAQKAVLLDLIDPGLPPEALASLRFDLLEGGVPQSIGDLERAYDAAYRTRTVAKRGLAQITVSEPERPRADVEAIAKKLNALGDRQAELATQIGAGHGQRQALERERGKLVEAIDRLVVELTELGPEEAARKAVTAAEQAVKAAQEAKAARQGVERQAAEAQARVKAIAALEASVARQGAECETCGTKLTPEKRQERVEALKVERQKLEGWLKHAQPGLGDGLATAERILEDAKRGLSTIGARQLEQRKEQARLKDLDAELARSPVATPALEAELAEVSERIRKGQQLAGEARALNQRWDHAEDAKSRRGKLEGEVAALERLCEVLGPKGLGERLLRERFDGVLGKLNRVLKRFGLEMSVHADPWSLRFNGRPAVLMSGSERWRAGFCFQIAVAALTEARFAVTDGADILDPLNQSILFQVATKAVDAGMIEQLIVTATSSGDAIPKGLTGCRVYRLPRLGEIERV